MNAYAFFIRSDGVYTWTYSIDPPLREKMELCTKKRAAAGVTVIGLWDKKSNTSLMFLTIAGVWGTVQYPWGPGVGTVQLPTPQTYALGRFPNSWSYISNGIVQPHNLGAVLEPPKGYQPPAYLPAPPDLNHPLTMPMGNEPMIPGQYIPDSYKNDPEEMEFFHGKYHTNGYFAQKQLLGLIKAKHDTCMEYYKTH